MQSDFGECRSILAKPPSRQAFIDLCELIGEQPREPEDPLLAYIEQHLARWPDAIARPMPEPWVDILRYELYPYPPARLCNCIEFASLYLDTTGLNHLLMSQEVERVRALDFTSCDNHSFSTETFEALGNSPHLGALRRLTMPYLHLDTDYIEALASGPNLAHITHLDLRFGSLDDEAFIALMGSPYLSALEDLNVSNNRIGAPGIEALAYAEHLRALKVLDVRYLRLSEEGAKALASSQNLSQLEWLHVNFKDLGDAGAKAIAESPYLPLPIRRYWRGV